MRSIHSAGTNTKFLLFGACLESMIARLQSAHFQNDDWDVGPVFALVCVVIERY